MISGGPISLVSSYHLTPFRPFLHGQNGIACLVSVSPEIPSSRLHTPRIIVTICTCVHTREMSKHRCGGSVEDAMAISPEFESA